MMRSASACVSTGYRWQTHPCVRCYWPVSRVSGLVITRLPLQATPRVTIAGMTTRTMDEKSLGLKVVGYEL